MVFLDSSVLIDHLGGRFTPHTIMLRQLIDGRTELVIGDFVLMEILQGVRHPRQLAATEAALAELVCFDLGGTQRARRAAEIYRHLRSQGISPRSPIDVLIATFCIDEGVELLANNRDYRLMAPHLALQLITPSVN